MSPAAALAPSAADMPACPAPGASVAEPYRWYPALDLARIPFHRAAGPWGPRRAVVAPDPPATRRTVNVTNAAQLAAEARIPGSLIMLGADFIGHAVLSGDVEDIDIVVPRGRTLGQLTIGRYSPPGVTRRVRIRGATPGTHSGGLIGSMTFVSPRPADIIIDGVDLNGADGSGGGLLWHFGGEPERVAIVNVRGHSPGSGSLHHGGVDIVIAGNRLMAGARPREYGDVAGYNIRGGDRMIVYGNRIDGTRYHRVRVHPRPGRAQYVWVADNIFVDPFEARIFSFGIGKELPHPLAAAWGVCNRVYAHTKCLIPSFDAPAANYAVLTGNTFFGSFTEARQRSFQEAHGPGRDYLSGNTFSAWQAPPPWTAPGDPTTIPLPPENPARYNPTFKTAPCPPP